MVSPAASDGLRIAQGALARAVGVARGHPAACAGANGGLEIAAGVSGAASVDGR